MTRKKLATHMKNSKGVVRRRNKISVVCLVLLSVAVLWVLLGQGEATQSRFFEKRSTLQTNKSAAHDVAGIFVLQGRVSHVADGDTINIQVDGERKRVRLASIDSPETAGRTDRPGQPYAQQARRALERMVLHQQLSLRCFEQDRYGRYVCDVPLTKTKTANQIMVEQGWAWAYTGSSRRYLRDESLVSLQEQAQQKGLGLWQSQKPVAPWVWRVECWQKKKCS